MRFFSQAVMLGLCLGFGAHAEQAEKFSYAVEWRLIDAGRVDLDWRQGGGTYTGRLHVQSMGLVSRLYRVNDVFDARGGGDHCAQETRLHAEEGSRRRETSVTWQGQKSNYVERDLLKDAIVLERQLNVPPCVHDVIAGMMKLRTLKNLTLGQSTTLPISDGKKFAHVRIEALDRERVTTKAGTFQTIRHEAFLFNDVLFQRNARLFVWLSDDARRLPVKIQVRMRIHIGTVSFELDKVEPPVEGMKK